MQNAIDQIKNYVFEKIIRYNIYKYARNSNAPKFPYQVGHYQTFLFLVTLFL